MTKSTAFFLGILVTLISFSLTTQLSEVIENYSYEQESRLWVGSYLQYKAERDWQSGIETQKFLETFYPNYCKIYGCYKNLWEALKNESQPRPD